MKKKLIIIIGTFLVIIAMIFTALLYLPEIKTDKQRIYDIFYNFPESNMIYYSFQSKSFILTVGPTIYQLYILGELTDEAYDAFINQIDYEEADSFEIKINPKKIKYNWKKIKNINIIEARNREVAHIQSIYLDENTKTIYIKAIGGN